MICLESEQPFVTLFQRDQLTLRFVTLPNEPSQIRVEALQSFLIYILVGLLILLKELSFDR